MKALARDKQSGGDVVRCLQALNNSDAERTRLMKIKGIMLEVRSTHYSFVEIVSFHPVVETTVFCVARVCASYELVTPYGGESSGRVLMSAGSPFQLKER